MNEESNSANGLVAQLGERLNGIQEVKGSIPFRSTIRMTRVSEISGTLFLCLKIEFPTIFPTIFCRRCIDNVLIRFFLCKAG